MVKFGFAYKHIFDLADPVRANDYLFAKIVIKIKKIFLTDIKKVKKILIT